MASSFSNPRASGTIGLMGSTGILPTPTSGFAGPIARGLLGRWGSGTPVPPPPPPTVAHQHGTGGKPIRIHPEAWREWQKKFEYDRILAAAVAKAHREREEEEFAGAMMAGLFD